MRGEWRNRFFLIFIVLLLISVFFITFEVSITFKPTIGSFFSSSEKRPVTKKPTIKRNTTVIQNTTKIEPKPKEVPKEPIFDPKNVSLAKTFEELVYVKDPLLGSVPINGDFSKYRIQLYSLDRHTGVMSDLKWIFGKMTDKFKIDYDANAYYPHCGQWGVCAKPERSSMDYGSVMSACGPEANANKYRRDYFNVHINQAYFRNYDGFICAHPAAVCEMFMPFNKTLIIVLTIPFDHGRENRERFLLWRSEIQALVKDPRNIIVSNNLYDVEYMNYFTGHRPIFIPALSIQEHVVWNPTRKEFIIHQARGVLDRNPQFAADFAARVKAHTEKKKYDLVIVGNKNLYGGHYTYQQLANHRAYIVYPYIKSLMSLFEVYSMNIPFFVPSLKYLAELEVKYGRVIYERTYWTKVPDVDPAAKKYQYSPLDFGVEAFKYWMKWSDFYLWKNVVQFDSVEDLCDKLMSTNFQQVHENMKKENEERKQYVFSMWEKVLRRSFSDIIYQGKRDIPTNFEVAMMKLYNMTIPSHNQGCPRESRPDEGFWTL